MNERRLSISIPFLRFQISVKGCRVREGRAIFCRLPVDSTGSSFCLRFRYQYLWKKVLPVMAGSLHDWLKRRERALPVGGMVKVCKNKVGQGQCHVSWERFHESAHSEPRLISNRVGSLFGIWETDEAINTWIISGANKKYFNSVSLPDITISDLFLSRRETESVESAAAPKWRKSMVMSDPKEMEAICRVQQLWVSTWAGIPCPGGWERKANDFIY